MTFPKIMAKWLKEVNEIITMPASINKIFDSNVFKTQNVQYTKYLLFIITD